MNTIMNGDPEPALREWRSRTLNIYLVIITIASLLAFTPVIIRSLSEPRLWDSSVFFIIIELVLIVIAMFPRLHINIRISTFMLIGYYMAIYNMYSGGFTSRGPIFLVAMPIFALIFVGKRAGIFTSFISFLLVLVFTILIDQKLVIPAGLGILADLWVSLAATLLHLCAVMSLLVLFYSFQESLIKTERHTQTELTHTQALLENQKRNLEQKVKENTEELQQRNKILIAMYQITDAASTARDMYEFSTHIHHIVGELMYANNFFIVVYDESTNLLSYHTTSMKKTIRFQPTG